MKDLNRLSKDYYSIEKAIYFLEENFRDQPDLEAVAKTAGMSKYHFQRVFQRWAGISPKKFLQFLTKEYARQLLKDSSLLDASYSSGLSGPGRLHDLFINWEAMSPGEYKQKGKGLAIDYGFHPTPFGECFIALTEKGICSLSFLNSGSRQEELKAFQRSWPEAKLTWNPDKTKKYIEEIFFKRHKKRFVNLVCRGTGFQIKVWEALLKIPPGQVVTYTQIARLIDAPKSMRAVGNAVGKNPIAYLIPCHRVIRGVGQFGGYRWGTLRKKMILGKEAALRTSIDRS